MTNTPTQEAGLKLAEVDATAQQVKDAMAVIGEAINRHTPSPQPVAQLGLVACYDLTSLARHPAPSPEPMQADLRETIAELRAAANGLFSLKTERGDYGYFDDLADRLAAMQAKSEPVAVTIFCPVCAVPHVDEGEWATTRHHKTHQCQGCGHEWRPFPFATVGVAHPSPSVPNPDLAGLVEAAFIAGATAVHDDWVRNPGVAPNGDPEFDEAARDYSASLK